MTERLKKVFPSLISYVQNGFMQGRQIPDRILIVGEVVGNLKAKGGSLNFQIDFEKAFDRK